MRTAPRGIADVRRSLNRALASGPVLGLWRMGKRGSVAVLAYHSVGDPTRFAEQMEALQRVALPIQLDDVIRAIGREGRLPPHAALVTFDDGDRTIVDVAGPMLQDRGIRAVAFVVAGVIGTQISYWWDEVGTLVREGGSIRGWPTGEVDVVIRRMKRCSNDERLAALQELRHTAGSPDGHEPSQLRDRDLVALERMGVEVANHTMSHPCLPNCSDEKVRSEIVEAHRRLSDILGHEPRAFAYPNGDWDPRAEAVLEELGYEAAFVFDHRLATPASTHPLRISRIRVNASDSLDRFAILVSGLHSTIHRLRGLP